MGGLGPFDYGDEGILTRGARMMKVRAIIAVVAVIVAPLWAQHLGSQEAGEKRRTGAERRPPAGPVIGLSGSAVKGKPFSAMGITEMTQTLSDGTKVHQKFSFNVYRDGEGRMRREFTDRTRDGEAIISDPVANEGYILNQKDRIARKVPIELAF